MLRLAERVAVLDGESGAGFGVFDPFVARDLAALDPSACELDEAAKLERGVLLVSAMMHASQVVV